MNTSDNKVRAAGNPSNRYNLAPIPSLADFALSLVPLP